jgi:hypothetical protein
VPALRADLSQTGPRGERQNCAPSGEPGRPATRWGSGCSAPFRVGSRSGPGGAGSPSRLAESSSAGVARGEGLRAGLTCTGRTPRRGRPRTLHPVPSGDQGAGQALAGMWQVPAAGLLPSMGSGTITNGASAWSHLTGPAPSHTTAVRLRSPDSGPHQASGRRSRDRPPRTRTERTPARGGAAAQRRAPRRSCAPSAGSC